MECSLINYAPPNPTIFEGGLRRRLLLATIGDWSDGIPFWKDRGERWFDSHLWKYSLEQEIKTLTYW